MGFRSARIEAGKKVKEVMDFMGVSDVAVYMWETGRMKPRADKLVRLAEFYGCSIEKLLEPEASA